MKSQRPEGFSLIEIIIVMALIGLTFVISFLAVRSAQIGQRDSARKDAVNRLVVILKQTGGNGAYPGCWSAFCAPPDGWGVPSSIAPLYLVNDDPTSHAPATSYIQWISFGLGLNPFGRCNGNSVNGVLQIPLEAGGFYCVVY